MTLDEIDKLIDDTRTRLAPLEVPAEEREQTIKELEIGKYPADDPSTYLKAGRTEFDRLKTEREPLVEQVGKARAQEQEFRDKESVWGQIKSFGQSMVAPHDIEPPKVTNKVPQVVNPVEKSLQSTPTSRFQLDDGEIVDTKSRQIISPDAFNKLSTPQEKAEIEAQLKGSGSLFDVEPVKPPSPPPVTPEGLPPTPMPEPKQTVDRTPGIDQRTGMPIPVLKNEPVDYLSVERVPQIIREQANAGVTNAIESLATTLRHYQAHPEQASPMNWLALKVREWTGRTYKLDLLSPMAEFLSSISNSLRSAKEPITPESVPELVAAGVTRFATETVPELSVLRALTGNMALAFGAHGLLKGSMFEDENGRPVFDGLNMHGAQSALINLATIGVLHGLAPTSRMIRAGAGAAIGGGLTLAQGGKPEQAIADAITFAAMSGMAPGNPDFMKAWRAQHWMNSGKERPAPTDVTPKPGLPGPPGSTPESVGPRPPKKPSGPMATAPFAPSPKPKPPLDLSGIPNELQIRQGPPQLFKQAAAPVVAPPMTPDAVPPTVPVQPLPPASAPAMEQPLPAMTPQVTPEDVVPGAAPLPPAVGLPETAPIQATPAPALTPEALETARPAALPPSEIVSPGATVEAEPALEIPEVEVRATPLEAKTPAVTVEDVHARADDLGIPWDDAPKFMSFTKQITGKDHLDDLDPYQLRDVLDALEEYKPFAVAPPKPTAKDVQTSLPAPPVTKQAVKPPVTPTDVAAHEAATSPVNALPTPTPDQISAGNFKMGHSRIAGLDISIEHPQGSVRSGKDKNGKPWQQTLTQHYGYIRGVPKGKDGDHLDVFVKQGTAEDYKGPVFVVDQVDPQTGKFDEVKVLLGFGSLPEARSAYLSNYAARWNGLGNISPTTIPQFKGWLHSGRTRESFSKRPSANWTKAATGAAREEIPPGVPNLADNEAAVPQSQEQTLPTVRSTRDNRVSAVAGELPGIPGRRGDEAIPGIRTGQEGQRQGVRAGKREVGTARSSGAQSTQQQTNRVSGEDVTPAGLGTRTRDTSGGSQEQASVVQVERRADTDDTIRSAKKVKPNVDTQRRDETNGPMGEGSGTRLQKTEEPDTKQLVRRKGTNQPDVVPTKSPRVTSNDYLNETINFGGTPTTRGSAIAAMQAEGQSQKAIDAYMMGAKTIPTPAAQATETATEPWQMTRKEWFDAKDALRGNGAYSTIRGGSAAQVRSNALERFNYGIKPILEDGQRREVDHKDVIEKALSEGKPVPAEVLADYPDLQADKPIDPQTVVTNALADAFRTAANAIAKATTPAEASPVARAAPIEGKPKKAEETVLPGEEKLNVDVAFLEEARKRMPVTTENLPDLSQTPALLDVIDNLLQIQPDALALQKAANFVESKATPTKGLLKRVMVDTKALRNIMGSKAFLQEGFGGLDVKAQRLVLFHVRSLSHDGQVLDSVVQLIPVDVVNDLASKEFPANVLLNDPAMLKRTITKHLRLDVPLRANVADALVRAVALSGAIEHAGLTLPDLIGPAKKRGLTGRTVNRQHRSDNTRGERVSQDTMQTKETPQGQALFARKLSRDLSEKETRAFIEKATRAYPSAPKMPETELIVADSTELVPATFLTEMAQRSYMKRLGETLQQAADRIQDQLGLDRPAAFRGFDLNMEHQGINVAPEVTARGEGDARQIFLNPHAFIVGAERMGKRTSAEKAKFVASRLVNYLTHEVTHQQVQGHGRDFRIQFQSNRVILRAENKELRIALTHILEASYENRTIIEALSDDHRQRQSALRGRLARGSRGATRRDVARRDGGDQGDDSIDLGRVRARHGEVLPARVTGPGRHQSRRIPAPVELAGLGRREADGLDPFAFTRPASRAVPDLTPVGLLANERGSMPVSQVTTTKFSKEAKEYKALRAKEDLIGFSSADSDIEARVRAAKAGVKPEGIGARLREHSATVWKLVSREFEHLPDTAQFAPLRTDLLRLAKYKGIAADQVQRELAAIIKPLSRKQYDQFEWKALLSDLAREAETDRTLPFGYTKEKVLDDLERLDQVIERDPKVQAAWGKRQALWERLKGDYQRAMDAIGFDTSKKLTKQDYFRHQILEYASVRALKGTGSRVRTPTGRGFLQARHGSGLDINANYVQAEFEVMAQMVYDTQVAKVVHGVDEHLNIRKRLASEAKARNDNAVQAIIDEGGIKGAIVESTMKDYRNRIGMHMGMARKALDLPKGERISLEELAEIADDPESPANLSARGVFKAISERKAYVQDLLGPDFMTWERLVPDTHDLWQPREGNVFYMADSIPAQMAKALQGGMLEEAGLTVEKLRKVMAMGNPREQYVIPVEAKATLDDLSHKEHSWFVEANRSLINHWKQLMLISPRRVLRYNLRNLTGDADAMFVGNPHAFLQLPRAAKDLFPVIFKDSVLSGEAKEWADRGGYGSTLQMQELGDVNDLRAFKHSLDKASTGGWLKAPASAWNTYWKSARLTTDYREALLRYSAYLDYLGQMQESPTGRPKNFGASIPETVMALEDVRDRAFKLSNELLGAYDRVSVAGQTIRSFWIPFWSWCVPDDSEILTRQGWKTHHNLVVGEEVLTFSMKQDAWEWQPVQGINRQPFDGNLQFAGKFRATFNHRWPVLTNQGRPSEKIVMREGTELAFDHQFLQTAKVYAEQESILSIRDAAILGWLVTDGYMRWRHVATSPEYIIYQKKPAHLAAILALVGEEGRAGKPHPNGTVPVRLKPTVARRLLAAGFRSKADLSSIVTRLSHKSALAMWQAMVDAEGSHGPRHQTFHQIHGPVLDAFQILTHLLGLRCNAGPDKNHYFGTERVIGVKETRKSVSYSGIVWCPNTPNGTWVMRQNGKVVITGNSEVNATRYVRLARNVFESGDLGQGARAAASGTLKAATFLVKLSLFWSMLQAWNLLMHGDDEDELRDTNPAVANRPHILFGRDEDGKIRYLAGIGALGDFLAWFGLDAAPGLVGDVMHDRLTIGEAIKAAAKAPVNKLWGGLTPTVKLPVELALRMSTYPDVFRPRPIQDRGDYLGQQTTFGPEIAALRGKPSKPLYGGEDLSGLLVQRTYPKAAAYGTWQGIEQKYLHRMGKESSSLFWRSPKGEALSNWSRAIQQEDATAETYWKGEYERMEREKYGYKFSQTKMMADIERSLRAKAPLAGVTKAEREQILTKLDSQERRTLERAEEYYTDTLLQVLPEVRRHAFTSKLMRQRWLSRPAEPLAPHELAP